MGELGNISGVVHGGAAPIGPARHAVPGLARMSATGNVKDDAVAATIRDAYMQTLASHRQSFDSADVVTYAERMREFVEAIRERIARLIELFEQIAAGPYSNSNLVKNFREQAEGINRVLDVLWEDTMVSSISAMGMSPLSPGSKPRGYAETGQALTTFKEELTQTSGSGESMFGLDGTADEMNSGTEFALGQISNVEKKMSEANQNLEVGMFSLARTREQAMKSLCSGAPEPERVLFLLQDS